jgi:antitoxin StbD
MPTAGDKPLAVLSHNRPAFYMVTPKLFQLLVDALADHDLAEIAPERLTRRHIAIDIDIDQIRHRRALTTSVLTRGARGMANA